MASAVGLLRTIINESNRAGVKRKSTFYSVFGACLRYFRQTGRTAFTRPQQIGEELSRLLTAVQAGEMEGQPEDVKTYFDAVTRAASDKGRRVQREDVLYQLITAVEGLQPAAPAT